MMCTVQHMIIKIELMLNTTTNMKTEKELRTK